MKIAILNTGSTNNRKGAFNNVHERIKHLQRVNGVEVDVFLIQHFDSWFFQLLRKDGRVREDYSIVDGIRYHNLWVKHKLTDYFLTYKLKIRDISVKQQLNKFVPLFKDYDLLSTHALPDIYLAYLVNKKYGIPFVTTWHGSDINIWPFVNKKGFETTKLMLEKASHNFFVSKRLMQHSDKIVKKNNKDYLYTGPSETFYKRSFQEKKILREKLKIRSKYVIGFIGNMIPVKNVLLLPEIFQSINRKIEDVCFILVGDGKLFNKLTLLMNKREVDNILYFGKVNPENIPDIMSSLDILLLPSLNEGMPRVTLEALACGVHVVGSDVGGIPESIGEENAFALDENFIKNISDRIITLLQNGENPRPLSEEFSWKKAINKEMKVYSSILSRIKNVKCTPYEDLKNL